MVEDTYKVAQKETREAYKKLRKNARKYKTGDKGIRKLV
jgi:hypothetical protein